MNITNFTFDPNYMDSVVNQGLSTCGIISSTTDTAMFFMGSGFFILFVVPFLIRKFNLFKEIEESKSKEILLLVHNVGELLLFISYIYILYLKFLG